MKRGEERNRGRRRAREEEGRGERGRSLARGGKQTSGQMNVCRRVLQPGILQGHSTFVFGARDCEETISFSLFSYFEFVSIFLLFSPSFDRFSLDISLDISGILIHNEVVRKKGKECNRKDGRRTYPLYRVKLESSSLMLHIFFRNESKDTCFLSLSLSHYIFRQPKCQSRKTNPQHQPSITRLAGQMDRFNRPMFTNCCKEAPPT